MDTDCLHDPSSPPTTPNRCPMRPVKTRFARDDSAAYAILPLAGTLAALVILLVILVV